MKERVIKVVKGSLFIFCIGLLYAGFVLKTGRAIPCLFREITGFYCPGCGITGVCISLLEGDIIGALESNILVMVLTPYFLFWGIRKIQAYIRDTKVAEGRMEKGFQILLVVLTIGFGIFRNL